MFALQSGATHGSMSGRAAPRRKGQSQPSAPGPRTPTRVRACNVAPINSLNQAANLSHRASVETCEPPQWHLEQAQQASFEVFRSLLAWETASFDPRITQSCTKSHCLKLVWGCFRALLLRHIWIWGHVRILITSNPTPPPPGLGLYSDNTVTNRFIESRWWPWEYLSSIPPSLFSLSLSEPALAGAQRGVRGVGGTWAPILGPSHVPS